MTMGTRVTGMTRGTVLTGKSARTIRTALTARSQMTRGTSKTQGTVLSRMTALTSFKDRKGEEAGGSTPLVHGPRTLCQTCSLHVQISGHLLAPFRTRTTSNITLAPTALYALPLPDGPEGQPKLRMMTMWRMSPNPKAFPRQAEIMMTW